MSMEVQSHLLSLLSLLPLRLLLSATALESSSEFFPSIFFHYLVDIIVCTSSDSSEKVTKGRFKRVWVTGDNGLLRSPLPSKRQLALSPNSQEVWPQAPGLEQGSVVKGRKQKFKKNPREQKSPKYGEVPTGLLFFHTQMGSFPAS